MGGLENKGPPPGEASGARGDDQRANTIVSISPRSGNLLDAESTTTSEPCGSDLRIPRSYQSGPIEEMSDEKLAILRRAESLLGDGRPASFSFRQVGDLEVKSPQWIVRDFLELDSLAIVFGPPGSAKSFLALDLAASIATGTTFHGRRITQQGLVLFVAGEGHAGLSRRLSAWSIARRVSLKNAPLLVSTSSAALCVDELVSDLERAIAFSVREWGPPRAIVFDTWARNMGGNEDSTLDATTAISAVDRLRRPWGSVGLIIHHSGHVEGRGRGNTALKAAADLELSATRKADGVVLLEATKIKDCGPPGPMSFRLCDVDLGIQDEDGRAVHSAVLEEVLLEPGSSNASALKNSQMIILDTLKECGSLTPSQLVNRGAAKDASGARGRLCELKKLGLVDNGPLGTWSVTQNAQPLQERSSALQGAEGVKASERSSAPRSLERERGAGQPSPWDRFERKDGVSQPHTGEEVIDEIW